MGQLGLRFLARGFRVRGTFVRNLVTHSSQREERVRVGNAGGPGWDWTGLGQADLYMGTLLNLSTAFHSQTYGQMEVVNQSLENLIRCMVGEHLGTWNLVLLRAHIAYNNC